MSAPTRRLMLGSLAGMAVVPVAIVSPVSPDAELIALCDAFNVLERQFIGLFEGPNRIDDEHVRDVHIEAIHAVQRPLLPRILDLPATTHAGIMARARAVFLQDLEAHGDAVDAVTKSPYVNDRLMAAMLRDLGNLSGVVS